MSVEAEQIVKHIDIAIVRFCLKHFSDITIFNISNFVILYENILN